jgi:hypothetical protein
MDRMNREQFYAAMAGLDEERLRKALWNLYWRGAAPVRERIDAEIAPPEPRLRSRDQAAAVDPKVVLHEVRDFIALARSGAYMAGDRRVSRTERSRWRFTFRRHLADARQALLASAGDPDSAALVAILDFASDLRDYDYFHTEDPVEAAGLVVSDEVALLWGRVLRRSGFPEFAKVAAPQLVRWESPFGWTRSGYGKVSLKETMLTDVLETMLPVPDAWVTFAGCYLTALDEVVVPALPASSWRSGDRLLDQRSAALARWHQMLLERFIDTDSEGLLDRVATHPALGGPELIFFQARLTQRRGDADRAADLIRDCLSKLPGHQGFINFAQEIGATLPANAQRIPTERRRGLLPASSRPVSGPPQEPSPQAAPGGSSARPR